MPFHGLTPYNRTPTVPRPFHVRSRVRACVCVCGGQRPRQQHYPIYTGKSLPRGYRRPLDHLSTFVHVPNHDLVASVPKKKGSW